MTAIGLINGLAQKGIKVPGDISVVGFDNIEMSSMINPPLTTVNQPSFETGKLSSKILLDNMEGKESSLSVTLEPTIVVRESAISI